MTGPRYHGEYRGSVQLDEFSSSDLRITWYDHEYHYDVSVAPHCDGHAHFAVRIAMLNTLPRDKTRLLRRTLRGEEVREKRKHPYE